MIHIAEYMSLSKQQRQAHLKLDDPCIEIGGNSTQFKGLLAHTLLTTIPHGKEDGVQLCHACHNGKCSNTGHLYWGTPSENNSDAIMNGRPVRRGFIPWNKGKKFSEEHRTKLSVAKKGKPPNNLAGKNQYSPG